MPAIKLNQRRVDALKPRKSAYDVRDRDLKGFGLRVWPSGKKCYFVHSQHGGRRVWKTIASAESTSTGEARASAATMLAAIRRGGDAPASPEEAVFEAVADEVFTRYARNWKPGTLKVNRNYYRNHILPRFKGHPIAGIDSRDVRQWFASLPAHGRGVLLHHLGQGLDPGQETEPIHAETDCVHRVCQRRHRKRGGKGFRATGTTDILSHGVVLPLGFAAPGA